MNNEQLKTYFLRTLQDYAKAEKREPQNIEDFWQKKLDPANKKELQELSGLFLPSVSDEYASSKTKIMLVGAETAGWRPLLKRDESGKALSPKEFLSYQSLENYIEKTMYRHAQVFENGMSNPKNDKGRTFFNYLRGLHKELAQIDAGYDSGGWVWTNLHCFDWGDKSPLKAQCYKSLIKPLSNALLNVQINVLKPDFIIFLSGMSAAKTRNEFLKGRCTGLPNQNNSKYLWEFTLKLTTEEQIHCIRTHHPSALSRNAQKALTESQKMLRTLIEKRPSFNH